MKIIINFAGIPILYKTLGKKKEVEVEFSGGTLRDLMHSLVRKFGPPIQKAVLDEKGDIDMEIRVLLNDGTYLTDDRMQAALKDGDTLFLRGAS